MSFSLTLLSALAAATLVFAVFFLVARRINNFGIVDIAWAAGFAPVAVFYAWVADGSPTRRLCLAVMVSLWSLRLGGYLARRVWSHHPVEDGRYQQLRRDWQPRLDLKMFLFFEAQALLLVALSVPFLFTARNANPEWRGVEVAGVALWLVALGGETLADAQLAGFRANPENKGRICDRGLWRWSRHPNYFFEWLVWIAFALVASGAAWGWVSLYCPGLMLFFLLKVTGVRYTEDQLLRSKGAAYQEYQRRTSAFVPWFPKPAKGAAAGAPAEFTS